MNFFGHAVLARRHQGEFGGDPRFVLGSMLPDFCSMARLRYAEAAQPALEHGVSFHHRTDDAFHGAPLFQKLMHDAQEELEEAGVSYGPALAVGHVGVELLLDGWLATEAPEGEDAARRFQQALTVDPGPITWRDGERSETRWQTLRARLRDSPLPGAYADPAFVADRMVVILQHRPRLALDPHGAQQVARWAPRAKVNVARAARALMREVVGRLDAQGEQRPKPASVGTSCRTTTSICS